MSDNRLKEAFDQIEPSDEAKQRMLDNIVAATSQGKTHPAPSRSRRSYRLKVALPLAASLILAAVGLYATTQYLPYFGQMGMSSSAPASTSHADSSASSEKNTDVLPDVGSATSDAPNSATSDAPNVSATPEPSEVPDKAPSQGKDSDGEQASVTQRQPSETPSNVPVAVESGEDFWLLLIIIPFSGALIMSGAVLVFVLRKRAK